MHVQFALFADAANVSQEGKLNILGVFDALHVGQLPAMHPRATFVVRIKAVAEDEGPHGVSLEWTSPSGELLWSSRGELVVGPAPEGAEGIDVPLLAVVDLPLDVPGVYTMIVAIDDVESARTALHVNQVLESMLPLAPPAPAGLLS
ncbi:MAG TPA: hypothetical protein VE861_10090 [Gemmatimonadaceae bacterium]|nr:hypothetical protein [Gemmatimonadaceae bacterium]